MTRILITGASGQLGSELQEVMGTMTRYELYPTDVSRLDICDRDAAGRFVNGNGIDIIINCAAYTAVDRAEDNEALAMKINRDGAASLAYVAASSGATLIHISTDYVFDGKAASPIGEDRPTDPIGVYGRTKLLGEQAILESGCRGIIIRTAWLYSAFGNNFVKTMRRLGAERDSLTVVCDQYGTPTYARDLARAIADIIPQLEPAPSPAEIYHYTDEGATTWNEFAEEILRRSGLSTPVIPVTTGQYNARAERPRYSVLDKSKIKRTFGIVIPDWRDSLAECIAVLDGKR